AIRSENHFCMSAKVLVCPPELGPALARRTADEDVRIVIALFVVDAERVAVMPGQPARREFGIHPPLRPPDEDQRRGLLLRIGPQIKRIGQANGRRQTVSRAKILNRSRFAIIANQDTDVRRLIRWKRIANAGNGFDEFVPAELLAQVRALAQGKIAQRTTGPKRHIAGKEVSTAENQASKEDGFDSVPHMGGTHRKPAYGDDRAHRNQRWIRLCDVVEAPLVNPEEHDRENVHPGEHAIPAGTEKGDEAGNPERRGERVYIKKKLIRPVPIGAALAHITRMDVLEHVI